MGLYLLLCLFFWCLAILCLNLILQTYMVAEAYSFWIPHRLLLIHPEIHLGYLKPTDARPPEGPDRPPPRLDIEDAAAPCQELHCGMGDCLGGEGGSPSSPYRKNNLDVNRGWYPKAIPLLVTLHHICTTVGV